MALVRFTGWANLDSLGVMSKKQLPFAENADTLSLKALRELVTGLVEKTERAERRLEQLEAEIATLRLENEELRLDNIRLKVENQLLRDEIARLKNLPPRPPFRSSLPKPDVSISGQASQTAPRRPAWTRPHPTDAGPSASTGTATHSTAAHRRHEQSQSCGYGG